MKGRVSCSWLRLLQSADNVTQRVIPSNGTVQPGGGELICAVGRHRHVVQLAPGCIEPVRGFVSRPRHSYGFQTNTEPTSGGVEYPPAAVPYIRPPDPITRPPFGNVPL
jgi:hypothetical protein